MYLDTDELLAEMSQCFVNTLAVKAGEKMSEQHADKLYIVAEGEMQLSTVIPTSQRKSLFQKGFLCSKLPGDIVNKRQVSGGGGGGGERNGSRV